MTIALICVSDNRVITVDGSIIKTQPSIVLARETLPLRVLVGGQITCGAVTALLRHSRGLLLRRFNLAIHNTKLPHKTHIIGIGFCNDRKNHLDRNRSSIKKLLT
eukprot:scaffold127374_cov93-Cyclotella_meneghiniana.AAC.1